MSDQSILDQLAQALTPQQNSSPGKTAFSDAMEQYPVLKQHNIQGKTNLGGGPGYLEFWPPGETGTPDRPRPTEFNQNSPGVEVYDPRTRPVDVLGDAASHWLKDTDPTVKGYYDTFQKTMTPYQNEILRSQYDYAKSNGDPRPFDQWAEISGRPGYFRGYAFDQWPKEFTDRAYTQDQRVMFDNMNEYLRGNQPGVSK